MTLQASKRFLSLATAAVFCANIILSGCAQKTAQNTSQAAASPSPGGLGNILGGSAASSSPTSAADSGGAGCFRNVGGAAGCAADILNSNGQTTPRQVINQTIERYKLIADSVPKSDFSVSALADTLPSDANLIDQWVRDKIRLDIYPGAMRGALGAILGRAANPTDKASLLAALLQRKGMQVRFARSTLTDAEAATLAGLVTSSAPAAEPATLPDTAVKQLAFSSADLDEVRQKLEPANQKNLNDGVDWSQKQADKLLDILSRRGVDVASASSADWPGAVRQHYYVQVNSNGAWVDLDPSAPSLQPGQHLGNADQSFSSPALPDDAYQAMKISVIAAYQRGASLQDQTLLTAAPKVVELVGQPLEISILPSDGSIKPADIGKATEFKPLMYIGDREFKGTVLDLQKDGAQLAEVRIEIATSAPGRPTQTYRRWVLDRRSGSGLAAMSQDALAHSVATLYQGLVAPSAFNESFAAQKISDYLQAMKPALQDLAAPEDQKSKTGLPLAGKPYPLRVLSFFMRDRLVADALEQTQQGVRLYLDRPDIAFVALQLPSAPAGTVVSRVSFDIVENGMAAAGGDAHHSARLNVARGILDTGIEQIVMSAKRPTGTMAVFKAARQQGVKQWVLAPADVTAAQKPSLGVQTSESLQDTLRAGQAAVAIERSVALGGGDQFGWWAVDPKNGSTVGRISGGAGNAASEYALLLKVINIAYHALLALAECSQGTCSCIVGVLELAASVILPVHGGVAGLAAEAAASAGIAGTHAMGACAHGGGGDHGGGGGEGGHGGGEGGAGGGGCGGYSGGCSGGVCGGG